ncbi:hypothetical protein F4775DRAFT_556350 [Biscogniauxia sp. FL1348]|nr:hypothetical protein F4775DRAFT_556350 [Biscogniauxia sp. FL1348]
MDPFIDAMLDPPWFAPPSQSRHAPLGIPNGYSRPYEQLQPWDYTPPTYEYQSPSSTAARYGSISPEAIPELMPVWSGITRTEMTPVPELGDVARTMHLFRSVGQHGNPDESVGDASHGTYGRSGDASGQESAMPENEAKDETPSPGEVYSDVAQDEYGHYLLHHREENSDPAPRTSSPLDESRNEDNQSSDAVTELKVEEQASATGWGDEDNENDEDDSEYRFTEESTSPYTSYVSSAGSAQSPAGSAAPQGSDHESNPGSDSDSNPGSHPGSNSDLEAMENANQESQHLTGRLRDLTAIVREAAAEFEGRPIFIVAGDCHLDPLTKASSSAGPQEASSVVLVAGDIYTYPSGTSASSSSRKKRERDDIGREGKEKRRKA